jgi:RNA polymerase sigma factor (sigma-70 family)
MVIPKSTEARDLRHLSVAGNSFEEEHQCELNVTVKKTSYTTAQDIKDVYIKHYKSFCQYATEKIKDTQMAEDIVADAFLRLMQKIDRMNADEIISRLYKLINIKCSDHIEEQQFLAEGISAFDVITPSDEAEIEAELSILINDELSKLPPQRKQIMLQLYMEGLTSQQVAQQMNLSRQTVINQKVRALKALRNNILKRLFNKK